MTMTCFEKQWLEVRNVLICVKLTISKFQASSVNKIGLLLENLVPVLTLSESER